MNQMRKAIEGLEELPVQVILFASVKMGEMEIAGKNNRSRCFSSTDNISKHTD
jgi:hypothetical protein